MGSDSWNIVRAEGGFIVHVSKETDQPLEEALGTPYKTHVFTESSALLNFLHNELVGSN